MSKRKKKNKPSNRRIPDTLLSLSAAERKLKAIEQTVDEDPSRALNLLEEMRSRYRLPTRYYALLVRVMAETGGDPIDILRAVLEAEIPDSKDADFLRLRGLVEANSGYVLAAYQDLDEARSADGDRGTVHVPTEHFEKVRQAAPQTAADLGFNWPDDLSVAAALDRCNALIGAALYAEAVNPLAEVVRAAPISSVARYYYAETLWSLCRYEEAVSVIGTPGELDDLALVYSGAKFHALLGHLEAAPGFSDRALSLPIATADQLSRAVQAHAWSGEHARVAATVEQHRDIVNAQPKYIRQGLVHAWAVASARTGDVPKAKELWGEIDTNTNDLYRNNLQAVEKHDDETSQPWYFEIGDLIPSAVGRMLDESDVSEDEAPALACRRYPDLTEILPQFRLFGGPGAALFADRGLGIESAGAVVPVEQLTVGSYTIYLEPIGRPPENIAELADEAHRLLQSRQPKKAELLLRKAISISSADPSVHQNLAVALEQQKKTEEALDAVREIHRRWPDYTFARCTLARVAADKGSTDEARDLVKPVLSRDALHVTEFTALCGAMCAINLKEYEWDELERWIAYWREAEPESSGMDRFEILVNAARGVESLIREPLLRPEETPPRELSQGEEPPPNRSRPRRKPKRHDEDPSQGELFP